MFEKEKNHIAITALIVLLVAGFAAAVRPGMVIVKETGEIYNPTLPTEINTPQLIGGQTDSHGCLGPAGFSWNETRQKCVREFSDEVQLASGTTMVNISDPNWREKLTLSVPISTDIKCVDSDDGKDYFTAGKVYVQGKTPKMDSCVRHRFLKEWYCSSKGTAVSTFVVCKKGCIDSVCRPEVKKVQLLGPPISNIMPVLNQTLGIKTEQTEDKDLLLK
jgi:hypothetical protein